jgi:hypothetical protein
MDAEVLPGILEWQKRVCQFKDRGRSARVRSVGPAPEARQEHGPRGHGGGKRGAGVGRASGQLVRTKERIVDSYAPEALVIYSGNNEWIRWVPPQQPRVSQTRIGSLREFGCSEVDGALRS